MKRCLSCGEKLYSDASMHLPCSKRVYNTEYVPDMDVSLDDIPMEPERSMEKFSVSNVQTTVPLVFRRREKTLTLWTNRQYDYLLKLPVFNIPALTQNQNLCMTIAGRLGVPVPVHSLIPIGPNDHGCIVKRYDMVGEQKKRVKTFDRILEKEDIHAGSLEEIGEKILRTSEIPGLDVQLFFEMVLFSFLVGHSDLHFKKFAVLYDGTREVRLAPMEDLVSTKMFRPDEEDFSIPMMGKTNNITGSDFKAFSGHLRIPAKSYERIFLRYFKGKRLIGNRLKHSTLETDDRIKFSDITNDRFKRLLL